jgi:hypothetical protein
MCSSRCVFRCSRYGALSCYGRRCVGCEEAPERRGGQCFASVLHNGNAVPERCVCAAEDIASLDAAKVGVLIEQEGEVGNARRGTR